MIPRDLKKEKRRNNKGAETQIKNALQKATAAATSPSFIIKNLKLAWKTMSVKEKREVRKIARIK